MVQLPQFPLKTGTLDNSAFIYINEGGTEKKLTVSSFLTKISEQYSVDINSFLASLNTISAFDSLNKKSADIASATTIDLNIATGNYVNITGTNAIQNITLASGKQRLVRFNDVLTLINGANLVLPSGENISTAAGDFAIFVGDASSVVRCVGYFKTNGMPVALPNATESTIGAAEIATQAETIAGTASKIVDPAKLLALFGTSNRSANGYARLPVKVGGAFVEIIIQWGYTTSKSSNSFPVTFPNSCLIVNATLDTYTPGSDSIGVTAKSASAFTVNWGSGTGIYWLSIGY